MLGKADSQVQIFPVQATACGRSKQRQEAVFVTRGGKEETARGPEEKGDALPERPRRRAERVKR